MGNRVEKARHFIASITFSIYVQHLLEKVLSEKLARKDGFIWLTFTFPYSHCFSFCLKIVTYHPFPEMKYGRI